MPELRLIDLEGDPRAVGEAHGRLAADLIAHNLAVYFKRFAAEARLPRSEVLGRAARYWAAVPAHSREFAAMVEGIAEGARQPLLEVAALNLRYELLYSEFSRIGRAALSDAGAPVGECTAFAVMPEASPDGHLRLGQNWDWFPEVAGLLLRVTRADGLRVLCFTEAGIAGGKIGLNGAGLGLCVNGLLSTEDDWSRLGRPFHLRTWEVLCSRTLDDAMRAVLRGSRSCSANFLVGAGGAAGTAMAVNLETGPGVAAAHPVRGGVFAHANHFLDADQLGVLQPLDEEIRSTYHRCRRMVDLLARASADGPVGAPSLQAILRDHDEQPDSICRHPSRSVHQTERYATIASIILDLGAGRMDVAPGQPCSTPYQEYTL